MRNGILLSVLVISLLASCAKEEIQNISADVNNSTALLKTSKMLTSNFLPTFTSYYGRDWGTSTNRSSSLASEWIHEYDDNGKLVKSSFFELYPYRILKEVTYLDIIENHKLIYEIKEYGYYGLMYSSTDTYELILDDNLDIKRIGTNDVLKELSDEGRVTKIQTVAPNGNVLYQRGYEYDEQGSILKYISYDYSGTKSSTVYYSYNENGDPLSYYFQNIYGAEIKVNYFYRDDNTLERLEEQYYHNESDYGTEVFTYSPEERISKKIKNRGDGSKEVVTYSEEEIVVESFMNDVLSEVIIYSIHEERYILNLQKEYIKGVLHAIKYYDADGELKYTEYYDEKGNLTETVYE